MLLVYMQSNIGLTVKFPSDAQCTSVSWLPPGASALAAVFTWQLLVPGRTFGLEKSVLATLCLCKMVKMSLVDFVVSTEHCLTGSKANWEAVPRLMTPCKEQLSAVVFVHKLAIRKDLLRLLFINFHEFCCQESFTVEKKYIKSSFWRATMLGI